jgi:uncharacterized membrane protein YbaN (DUF454 family)
MLKRSTAYVCLAIGVAGVVLPLLPGVPFLLAGFKLLGPDHSLTRGLVRVFRKYSKER